MWSTFWDEVLLKYLKSFTNSGNALIFISFFLVCILFFSVATFISTLKTLTKYCIENVSKETPIWLLLIIKIKHKSINDDIIVANSNIAHAQKFLILYFANLYFWLLQVYPFFNMIWEIKLWCASQGEGKYIFPSIMSRSYISFFDKLFN